MMCKQFNSLILASILSLSLLLISPGYAWAATYHVNAVDGDDVDNGLTPSSAWRTISRVNNAEFLPGDQVLFHRGDVWRETLLPPSSGSATQAIVFGAYGSGARPVLSGADHITSADFQWIPSGDGSDEYFLQTGGGGAPAIVPPFLLWVDQAPLSRGTAGELSTGQWDWADNDDLGYETIYLLGPPSPEELVEAAARSNVVDFSYREHLRFENLELRQVNLSDGDWGESVVLFSNSQNITFQECLLREGHYAVFYAYAEGGTTEGIVLDSCIIYGCRKTTSPFGSVVKLDGVNDSVIRNCTISESNNGTFSDVITLWDCDSNIVEGNDISGPAGNCLYLRPHSDDNIIRYNRFHDSMGGQGVQIRNGSSGTQVYYNLIYNMEGGPAIQSDGDIPITGTRILNNTIFTTGNNNNGISLLNTNTNAQVINNIVFVAEYSFALSVHENSTAGLISDHNIFRNENSTGGNLVHWAGVDYDMSEFGSYQALSHQDEHSSTTDPMFNNVVGADFHLAVGSPGFDAGQDVGLTRDLEGAMVPQGDAPEIGVFEIAGVSGVMDGFAEQVGGTLFLRNSPNPFEEQTVIFWRGGPVRSLNIFDVAGRKVRRLTVGAGVGDEGRVVWNGRDDLGRQVPLGVYFARVVICHFILTTFSKFKHPAILQISPRGSASRHQ